MKMKEIQIEEKKKDQKIFFKISESKRGDELLEDPETIAMRFTQERISKVIHKTDRSVVYEIRIPDKRYKNNENRFILKRAYAHTKQIIMEGRQNMARRLLERRIRNNIFSSKRFYEKGINTDIIYFRGGMVGEKEAWLAYDYLHEGVFFDDYLATRETLSDKFSLESVLNDIALSLIKLHGKKGEKGYLHDDINTGNIFLPSGMRDKKTMQKGEYKPQSLFIDWELCEYSKKSRFLSDKERIQELYTLVGANRNLNSAAALEKKEFLLLKELYMNHLNNS